MTRLDQTLFVAAALALTAFVALKARLLSIADPNGFERCARVAGTALEFCISKR